MNKSSVKATFDRSEIGQKISERLIARGMILRMPCAGEGRCGKCLVRVISGTALERDLQTALTPDENGCVKACSAYVGEGLCVEVLSGSLLDPAESGVPDSSGGIETPDKPAPAHINAGALTAFLPRIKADGSQSGTGIALDVGTTTLAAALIDRSTGRILSTTSAENPQAQFGADVMSRICAAADPQKLDKMQAALARAVNRMIKSLCEGTRGSRTAESSSLPRPDTLFAAGNTTMLHIFCKVSPVSMGKHPFTPVFTGARRYKGSDLSLDIENITVLPSLSAFIGADILCGIYALSLTELSSPSLMIDVGTNGECVLCTGKYQGGRMYALSTAAGPALEGGSITCGCPGIPGAVCSFSERGFETICGAPPVGICGSGLVDLVAYLLGKGLITPGASLAGGRFDVADGVYITSDDLREFALAKSALRAGLEYLAGQVRVSFEELENIFLCGGMGYYLNAKSAVRAGMLPKTENPVVSAPGNSSLAGVCSCLCASDPTGDLEELKKRMTVLEPSGTREFEELFIKNLSFLRNDDL